MQKVSKLFEQLFVALAALSALILLFMVALVTLDVVLRNLELRGFIWVNEISEYSLYLMTVLIAPYLLRRGQHIRLDIFLVAVPSRFAWWCEVAGDIFGIAVCSVFFFYSVGMTADSWKSQSLTVKNLVFPEWWLLVPLPIVFMLLTIEFCFRVQRMFDGDGAVRKEATSAA